MRVGLDGLEGGAADLEVSGADVEGADATVVVDSSPGATDGRERMTASFTSSPRLALVSILLVLPGPVSEVRAQTDTTRTRPDTLAVRPDSLDTPFGSELLVPFGSLVVPGLGQYVRGAGWAGAGYTGVWIAGGVVGGSGNVDAAILPRDRGDQLAMEALHVAFTSGALSAWDAFHRAVPKQQRAGRYTFLDERESIGALLTAPFDPEFLGRWTTWVDLAFTGVVAGVVMADREPGLRYPPYRFHDAAFITSLSLNAAVGEEALFRGWLLPVLHQKLGRRFWAANLVQATLFGLGHLPQADRFALVIGAGAAYSGWLTRRNGWGIREVVFQHFWYDLIVGTALLLRDENAAVPLPAMTIRF